MKVYITFLFLVAFYMARAQTCIADAGPDRTVCVGAGNSNPVQVGGYPAGSGVPPLVYYWSASYTVAVGQNIFTLTASDFLSDTTIANPFLLAQNHATHVPLVLTVADAEMNSCSDSVWITYSIFALHLGQLTHHLKQGDTLHFTGGANVGGGIPPLSYKWRPNHGLLDSTNASGFSTRPLQSTNYYVVVTDAAGCIANAGEFVFVVVEPLSVTENSGKPDVRVYYDPAHDKTEIIVATTVAHASLEVTELSGKEILASDFETNSFSLDVSSLNAGMYILKISDGNKLRWTGKFLAR